MTLQSGGLLSADIALAVRGAGAVDISARADADIPFDPCDQLPFVDRAVASIALGDFVASLSTRDQVQLLGECRRVLAPSGELVLVEPRARDVGKQLARWAAIVGLAEMPASASGVGWRKQALSTEPEPLVSLLIRLATRPDTLAESSGRVTGGGSACMTRHQATRIRFPMSVQPPAASMRAVQAPRNEVTHSGTPAQISPEASLVGSTYYVDNLPEEEHDRIALYLNFDMIGSPNHVFFIYDGDDSDVVGAGPRPDGSAEIEEVFQSYYNMIGQPFKGTDFSGRSDYGPFIAAGIPAGGLFTGAEGIKTVAEVALWGGTAGQQYDPCYHLACDNYDNINLFALDVNADAVAYAVLQFAMNTEIVNGKRGKGNSKPDYWGPQAIK